MKTRRLAFAGILLACASASTVSWADDQPLPAGAAATPAADATPAAPPTPAPPPPNYNQQLKDMMTLLQAPGNAPLCEDPVRHLKFPSKVDSAGNCDDGDMTLFNGMLCIAGVAAGCDAIKASQIDGTGEWLRSPRFVSNRVLRPSDSFSPDMAMGVQLYAAYENNPAVTKAFSSWLQWIEDNRPCVIGGEPNCVRGLPRFCRDDSEHGCTLRPGDIVALSQTVTFLKVTPPEVLGQMLKQGGTREFRDDLLFADANVNDLGFSLHLVSIGVLLARLQGDQTVYIQAVGQKLSDRQPLNPLFAYLAYGPTDAVKKRVLEVCPTTQAQIPTERSQWAWERADSDQAWKKSMVWDCIFMGSLLLRGN